MAPSAKRTWRLLTHWEGAADFHMGFDEALLLADGPPTLRFYTWEPWALSLGYFKDPKGEAFIESIEMNRPATVSANLGVLLLMFGTLAVGTMFVLSQKRELR